MKKILLILLIGVSSCQKSSNVTPDPKKPEIKKTIQESTKIGEAGSSTIYEFKHEGKTYIIVSKSFSDGGIAIIEHNKAQESEL